MATALRPRARATSKDLAVGLAGTAPGLRFDGRADTGAGAMAGSVVTSLAGFGGSASRVSSE